jgi:two-component system catabolic regulation response regulator CreB
VHGFELARDIRHHYDVPLIFVTARSSEIDRVVGLEIGADDYVVKPFSPRELAARVRAVLRRASTQGRLEAAAPPRLDHRFALDDERQRLSYHGVVLELSRYEFRLLRVLVTNPGRVYSRERLMQLGWEEPERSLERTVDTHIKTLRQKLKAVCPDEDPIVTYRGVGYALGERP